MPSAREASPHASPQPPLPQLQLLLVAVLAHLDRANSQQKRATGRPEAVRRQLRGQRRRVGLRKWIGVCCSISTLRPRKRHGRHPRHRSPHRRRLCLCTATTATAQRQGSGQQQQQRRLRRRCDLNLLAEQGQVCGRAGEEEEEGLALVWGGRGWPGRVGGVRFGTTARYRSARCARPRGVLSYLSY